MINRIGERGFVTIATGHKRYYSIAVNLLLSYRKHAVNPLPFVIISDRENEFTAQFDATIIMDHPTNSYIDKLRLFEFLPFDETIFIDADCLAYADLNVWWETFAHAGDFCVFGFDRELSSKAGWFLYDGMKEFREHIKFIPSFNGGVYYMRNTSVCERVFSIAQHCAAHYDEYSFCGFQNPADEPVLAMGMAVCDCKSVHNQNGREWEMLFAPDARRLEADILTPYAFYHSDADLTHVKMVHWGNWRTERSRYHEEIWKMKHQRPLSFPIRLVMKMYDPLAYCKRYYRAGKKYLMRIVSSLQNKSE